MFSSEEIIKHEFSKAIRGYDPIEVDAYLEVLSEKVSELLNDNKDLKEKLDYYEKSFKELEYAKNKFRDEQVETQKLIKGLKVKAEKDAKIILMDAKVKSENILNNAYTEVNRLRQEIDELKVLRTSFLTRFKNILRQQLDTLEIYSNEVKNERNNVRNLDVKEKEDN